MNSESQFIVTELISQNKEKKLFLTLIHAHLYLTV